MTVRILGINGGLRAEGSAARALKLIVRMLESADAHVETFDIGTLPLWDGREDELYPAAVAAWRAACEAADGFAITVPTFHGGMPGALKNALDFLDVPQAGGKPFALIGIAGGDAEPGVTDTSRALRHIGATAAIHDVVISRSRDHWGDGDEPANKGVVIALAKIAEDLLSVCQLRSEGRLPQP